MENVEKMSPAVLANVGILMMTSQDVGWKMMLVQWLEKCDEADKELMTGFCDIYIEKTIDYLSKCCQPHMFGNNDTKGCPRYKRVINHSVENMVSTFTTLLDVSIFFYFCNGLPVIFHAKLITQWFHVIQPFSFLKVLILDFLAWIFFKNLIPEIV